MGFKLLSFLKGSLQIDFRLNRICNVILAAVSGISRRRKLSKGPTSALGMNVKACVGGGAIPNTISCRCVCSASATQLGGRAEEVLQGSAARWLPVVHGILGGGMVLEDLVEVREDPVELGAWARVAFVRAAIRASRGISCL